MSKIELNIEEVTEPQIFNPPRRMITWSYREGKHCYVCEMDVVAILPPLPSHANVVCLNGQSLWWASHCGIIKETDEDGIPVNLKESEVQEKPCAVYDCYQPAKARELFLNEVDK